MSKFSLNEIVVIINGGDDAPAGTECEIVSKPYHYCGYYGYDIMVPGIICTDKTSKNGEWFGVESNLRKKKPSQEELKTWEQLKKDLGMSEEEMSRIKSLFWGDEDTVIQYHPPKSEYVNCHPYCLHLWRPVGVTMPLPDSILVGPKEKQNA